MQPPIAMPTSSTRERSSITTLRAERQAARDAPQAPQCPEDQWRLQIACSESGSSLHMLYQFR
jgi:hypothetical protein